MVDGTHGPQDDAGVGTGMESRETGKGARRGILGRLFGVTPTPAPTNYEAKRFAAIARVAQQYREAEQRLASDAEYQRLKASPVIFDRNRAALILEMEIDGIR